MAKFFEVNVKVSEKMQGEAAAGAQAARGAAGAGGGGGGGGGAAAAEGQVDEANAVDAEGNVKAKGQKGILDGIGELWDDGQYEEEFNLDGFLKSMKA